MKQMVLFGTITLFLFTHSIYAKKGDKTLSSKWKNGMHRLAYEDFFLEKEIGPGSSIAYKHGRI